MADVNKVVDGYIALRQKIKDVETGHKLELQPMKDMLERVELFLMTQLVQNNVESMAARAGTFFKVPKTSAIVANRDTFLAWIKETDNWDLADIRAAKINILLRKTETGLVPPGITWTETTGINIRKGTKNGNSSET